MTRHWIFDDYDWQNYHHFGGSFIPSHRILKMYFTQLKTLIKKQRNQRKLETGKISLELDETQFKMLLDGLERASGHEELSFKNDMHEAIMDNAFREFKKHSAKSRDKGYRAACKAIGIAPGKRPPKISPDWVISTYKDFYEKDSSMKSRYEAINHIVKEAKSTPEYIIKIIKTIKKKTKGLIFRNKTPYMAGH